ncbi:MAG TPA: ribonuclease III [Planctomycetota bacterium]|nr:ribonuclease III [Planctomycetota bacterium]
MRPAIATREVAETRERESLSPLACFSDTGAARPEPEPPDEFRTAFVRDRDRIVHCGAFRRLKDKTQVFVIDEGDFYRTRLTHTLEVAQMARFLCLALRLNDGLAEAVALVHDIGHPPFGHEGERILDECAGVPFDHNRQALRIVDVLEAPYPDRSGLNLTQVVRRSILKHGGDAGRGAPVVPGLVLEAQAVDLADSTAYQHHDLEDGLRAGILTEAELLELEIWRQAVAEQAQAGSGGPLDGSGHLKAVLGRMVKSSLHDIVNSSAEALAACGAKDSAEVAAAPGRLVRMSPARAAMHGELGRFLLERFYRHPRVLRSAALAGEAIALIVEHFHGRPEEMPLDYRRRVESDGLGRSVCDYVAGMTDRYAMDERARLVELRTVLPAPPQLLGSESRVAALEQAVGYVFHDKELAVTALTHASARSDSKAPNERLEFLGDSVLGLAVAQELYQRYPDREEGELSRIKSAVVSRHALRRVGQQWELAGLLTLGPGMLSAGEVPASVVADAVEAVLGAIFLDGGLPPVRRLVTTEFGPLIEASSDRQRSSNYKSELQNWTQGTSGQTPQYEVLEETGPDHAKTFTVAAVVEGRRLATATGHNKRQAEQRAARAALALLKAEALGLASSGRSDAGDD